MTRVIRDFNGSDRFCEQRPLLSVCIITYNHEAYLAQAIESVLGQETDFSFEIIIGEDNSSDNTRRIAIEYADRYPGKIRLMLNDRKDVIYVNGKATGRWNLIQTLSNATGKYVALVEGDDFWTDPLKLQNQVDFLEAHPEYTVSGHLVKVVDTKGDRFGTDLLGSSCPEIFTIENVLKGPPVHTSSLVFLNFDIGSHYLYRYLFVFPAGDVLIIAMLLGLGRGYCFNKTWSSYRLHPGGFWSTKPDFVKYFESFQIEHVFSKLYPKYFRASYIFDLCSLLSQAYMSAIALAVRRVSIAPITMLISIAIGQKVVPFWQFFFLNLVSFLFVPLRGATMIFKFLKSIVS